MTQENFSRVLTAAFTPALTPAALPAALMWFRRDLRDFDNAALAAALRSANQVFCVFVFDRDILEPLLATENPFATPHDRRVEFIWHSVAELDAALRARGGGLFVRHGRAGEEIPRLAQQLGVPAVFANEDYEPAARQRDAQVADALAQQACSFFTYKDTVVLAKSEVLTGAGKPFSVFTPYKNAWLKKLSWDDLAPHDCEVQKETTATQTNPTQTRPVSRSSLATPPAALDLGLPTLEQMGFAPTNLLALGIKPGMSGGAALFEEFEQRMHGYQERRDFPALKAPSYLSVHLRFGTVSIRGLARAAYPRMQQGDAGASTWLSELIWREFYFQVLWHFPHAAQRSFKPAYDAIRWEDNDAHFAAWCAGRTGYPLVDAAMAQLNHSGYMHNRLRMVVASFLTKDLGISWQRGEAYFAARLNDFDLAANNGGWQWAASSGCDAQPYFRIFNPVSQSEKFDAEGKFIRKYLPQLAGLSDQAIHAPWLHPVECAAAGLVLGRDYPLPLVPHDLARKKTLERYAVVKAVAAA